MEKGNETNKKDTPPAADGEKKNTQKLRRSSIAHYPMTSMKDIFGGSAPDFETSSGVVTFGFDSDTAHPAVSESAEDTHAGEETAGRSPELGPSVRSRRRVREADTVSPSHQYAPVISCRCLLRLQQRQPRLRLKDRYEGYG